MFHPGNVLKRVALWNRHLPGVEPYYAVKCNAHPLLLKCLAANGVHFDVASTNERRKVKGHTTIWTNPNSPRADLRLPGVYVVDSIAEREKLREENPDAKVLLRIRVNGGGRVPLNTRFGFFGTSPVRGPIHGLAFHVGSDCSDQHAFADAFKTVQKSLHLVTHPELLDIGGGFSGSSRNDPLFKKIAWEIRKHVPQLPFQKCIAEPGRFFAEESMSMRVQILGRKTLFSGEECITINESTYGAFSGVVHDGFRPVFTSPRSGPLRKFIIFGHSCDSSDIVGTCWLPTNIREGDSLECKNMGAYSFASASRFGGFPLNRIQRRTPARDATALSRR